jgi:putative membrane protein
MDYTVLTTLALAAGPVGHHFGFGWLFFLIPLFWIALVVLIVGLFGRRWRRRAFEGGYGPWAQHGHWGNPARSAESTLAERFAQGDIDEKEYRARLEVLRANNAHQGPAPK